MIKILNKVMIIALFVSLLLNLSSCFSESCIIAFIPQESYKEFRVKNITYEVSDDYFTSEEMSFARINNVVIIPEVKAITHEEYIIYVLAYSKSGNEIVQIRNVVFKEKEVVLFKNEVDEELEFEQFDKSIYKAWINGGIFTEESVIVASGKKYDLIIEVDVFDDGSNFSKDIIFEIDIIGYKSVVWPT